MKKVFSVVTMCSILLMACQTILAASLNDNYIDGGYVYFGRYPQTQIYSIDGLIEGVDYVKKDNKYYKIEPIKWRVMSENNNELLILSEKNLDVGPFDKNSSNSRVSWGNCDLAKWLNSNKSVNSNGKTSSFSSDGFLKAAFTADERDEIIAKPVQYTSFASFPFGHGRNSVGTVENQKVFLLSKDYFGLIIQLNEEFRSLFNTYQKSNIIAENTDFVKSYKEMNKDKYSAFWLIDSLSDTTLLDSFETAFVVNNTGRIGTVWVERNACIRPAITINKLAIQ